MLCPILNFCMFAFNQLFSPLKFFFIFLIWYYWMDYYVTFYIRFRVILIIWFLKLCNDWLYIEISLIGFLTLLTYLHFGAYFNNWRSGFTLMPFSTGIQPHSAQKLPVYCLCSYVLAWTSFDLILFNPSLSIRLFTFFGRLFTIAEAGLIGVDFLCYAF